MLLYELLEVIDKALSDKAYRRKLTIRAIEDCIIILRLCLWTAAICLAGMWFMKIIGL